MYTFFHSLSWGLFRDSTTSISSLLESLPLSLCEVREEKGVFTTTDLHICYSSMDHESKLYNLFQIAVVQSWLNGSINLQKVKTSLPYLYPLVKLAFERLDLADSHIQALLVFYRNGLFPELKYTVSFNQSPLSFGVNVCADGMRVASSFPFIGDGEWKVSPEKFKDHILGLSLPSRTKVFELLSKEDVQLPSVSGSPSSLGF